MGRGAKDIAGMTFGLLTALAPTKKRQWGNVVWVCRCECGNKLEVPLKVVLAGSACPDCLRLRDLRGRQLLTRHIDPKRLRILKNCSAGKITTKRAGDIMGVTKERARQLLIEAGLPKANIRIAWYKRDLELLSPYFDAYQRGRIPLADLIAKTGLTRHRVIKILHQEGIKQLVRSRPRKRPRPALVISDADAKLYTQRQLTQAELAAKYGYSKPAITLALIKQGLCVSKNYKNKLVLSKEDCYDLATFRTSIRQVAAKLGVTPLTVRSAMYRQGVCRD